MEEEVFLPWSCCLSESRYSPKNLENRISSDGSGGGPVAQANTIRWRLEEKKRLEKEEEEDERRRAAEEEDRRRKERERTRNPGPFSPEVMVAEGPVLLEDSWCRLVLSYLKRATDFAPKIVQGWSNGWGQVHAT